MIYRFFSARVIRVYEWKMTFFLVPLFYLFIYLFLSPVNTSRAVHVLQLLVFSCCHY